MTPDEVCIQVSLARESAMAGPARLNDMVAASPRSPTLNDLQCDLAHHISRLNEHLNMLDYHGLRKRLAEEILPLASKLEDTVNRH